MDLVRAASAELERAVRQLPADSWDLPTPSEITVRELVEHVVVGNRFTAMLLAGASRVDARAALGGDQLGPDPLAAVLESARAQQAGFATTSPETVLDGPKGDITAQEFRRFRLIDLVVHAWDLLRATGQDERLDPDVVRGLLAVVEPHLDAILAFGAYGDGPSGTLPPDTDPQHRLLDMFGRRP